MTGRWGARIAAVVLLLAVGAPAHARPARCGLPASPLAQAAATRAWSAPGVTLDVYRHQGQAVYVLNATLGPRQPRVDAGPLLDGAVTTTRTVPDLLAGSTAAAAVNGDFFHNRTSNAPLGPVVVRGGGVRAAAATPKPALVVQHDHTATLARVWAEQTIHAGGQRLTADAFNSPHLPPNGVAVLNRWWGSTPRRFLNPIQAVREVHVSATGRVTATHPDLTSSPTPEGGFVLVAQGTAAARLARLQPGDRVHHHLRLHTDAPGGVHSAIGVGMQLLGAGRRVFTTTAPPPDRCATHDPPVARTAVGVTGEGRQLLLVAVARAEAEPDPAAAALPRWKRGLSVIDTAAFLRDLGAAQAAMLDGGGSTALAVRAPAGPRAVVRSSDPEPRPVPNAYALWP